MIDIYKNKIKGFLKRDSSLFFILFISIILFVFVFLFNFIIFHFGEQQFMYLANSFLHGKTYFLSQPATWMDTVLYHGKYYWPLGFFPAIVMIPFVIISNLANLPISQSLPSLLIGLCIFYFIYKIARKIKYTQGDSLYWAFAFCFSSVFISALLCSWSWWFAHVITVFLLFAIILEFLNKKRYWFIGLLFGLAFLTRATGVIGVVFLFFEIFCSPINWKVKFKNILNLILPICMSIIVFLFYNYIRFGNFLESGYSGQILIDSLVKARSYGTFGLIHIPGNLYYFLFSSPLPVFKDGISHVLKFPYLHTNIFGMSIFITSPYFIYLFFISLKKKEIKWSLVATIFIALAVFSYYGIGYNQFGYRYSLDFLPFLFFALIIGYYEKSKKISLFLKFIIIIGALFNIFLFSTMFNIF